VRTSPHAATSRLFQHMRLAARALAAARALEFELLAACLAAALALTVANIIVRERDEQARA